jgi:F-type H+-transporting ATPase subunit a
VVLSNFALSGTLHVSLPAEKLFQLGPIPFTNSMIFGPIEYNGVPLFRGPATDLNVTFALAVITMVAVQIFAIMAHGLLGNGKRYFISPFKDPAHSFEGILELIAEFSRGTALSLRLFGNVFAGEILVAVIAFLSGWVTPLSQPFFLAFELFIGIVQAYVFFMLSVVFISLGSTAHAEHKEAQDVPVADKPVGMDSEPVKS